jgi:hypothetical protein
MGFFSRLFGTEEAETPLQRAARSSGTRPAAAPINEDQALERYRYMLRTAPPETVEQAHAEAFAKLSPEQRQQVLAQLAKDAPEAERASVAATRIDDPQALARVATRAEVRQPGTLERSLGSGGMGFGASLLSSFAMGFVGSMVANSFFSAIGGFGGGAEGEAQASQDAQADDTSAADEGDADYGGDDGDFGGGDFEI